MDRQKPGIKRPCTGPTVPPCDTAIGGAGRPRSRARLERTLHLLADRADDAAPLVAFAFSPVADVEPRVVVGDDAGVLDERDAFALGERGELCVLLAGAGAHDATPRAGLDRE